RGPAGNVGTPADARHVTTVGSLSGGGPGEPPGLELLRKPDLLAPGPEGAEVGFAAGVAAATHGAGAPLCGWREALGRGPGAALPLPADWPPRAAQAPGRPSASAP